MIIFVPEGDDEDIIRLTEYYDGTYEYLKSIGIKELEMSNIVDLFNKKCPSNFKNWVQ